jgi:hypothetical protein
VGGVWPRGLEYADAARHLDARISQTRLSLKKRPQDTRLLLRLANLRYQRAYTRALDAYSADPTAARHLESGDDRHYHAWMQRALYRDPSGDLRESARVARLGLELARDPERRWELLRCLARTECARGAHDRELKALEAGQALRPGDPDVLSRLARAYGETGDRLALEETLEDAWQAARRRGMDAPGALAEPAAASGAPPRPEDRRWASTAHDGDEWVSGLYVHAP